nr:MAG TPA: hypothetical protein [Bacteriophage sp.]
MQQLFATARLLDGYALTVRAVSGRSDLLYQLRRTVGFISPTDTTSGKH